MSATKKLKGLDAQPPRPNDCTYWVTDKFIAGEHPADPRGGDMTRQKLRGYLDCGITYFVDLTHEGEKEDYLELLRAEAEAKGIEIGYQRLPIRDFGIPRPERMKEILNAIDDAVEQNHKVYVHCRGGIGRTGTTVGCYLVKHGNEGSQALDEVNRLFQNSGRSRESYYSPETKAQMDFVRNWQQE